MSLGVTRVSDWYSGAAQECACMMSLISRDLGDLRFLQTDAAHGFRIHWINGLMIRRLLLTAFCLFIPTISGCQESPLPEPAEASVDAEAIALKQIAEEAVAAEARLAVANIKPAPEYESTNESRVLQLDDSQIESADADRVSSRFPNIKLLDQHGNEIRFYDDLVKDQVVVISFFYTRCTGSCPMTTARLERLRDRLKDKFGQELRLISITLEPDVDTPQELRKYMDRYQISDDPDLPQWSFVCGDFEEVETVRRALGVYDLDPIIDADKTEHAAIVTFGNDRTDRWAALPVAIGVRYLEQTVVRISGNSNRQRYADAVLLGRTAHGHLEQKVKLQTEQEEEGEESL